MHKKTFPFCLFTIKENWWRVIREVTNTCNYSCSYCIFSSKWHKISYDVPTEKVKSALKEMYENGILYLKITWGEPFVRPDLVDILEYASALGFEIDISTNASFLTEEKIERISKLNISYIHVSLDGCNKEMQEKIRGKDTFDPTIKWIRKLVSCNMHVRIWTVLYNGNENSIPEIVDYVKNLWVKHIIFSYMEAVWKMRWQEQSDILAKKSPQEIKNIIADTQWYYKDSIKIDYSFVEDVDENTSWCDTCPWWKQFFSLDHKWRLATCTWIAEYFPEFTTEKTLHDYSFSELLHSSEIYNYYAFIDILKQYGIYGCPKKNLWVVKEFLEIYKIFTLQKTRLYKGYKKIAPLYSFTTENILWYLPSFDMHDKKVLTIWWSWDHMLNSYLQWASIVQSYDINLLTKFYWELKWYAVLYLSYNEFLAFFMIDSDQALDFDVYKKLRNYMSVSSQFFWDSLYKYFDNSGVNIRKSEFFNNTYDQTDYKISYNTYLQDEWQYNTLQTILQNKYFHREIQDIKNLPSLIRSNTIEWLYDVILLSNISDYITDLFPWWWIESLQSYENFIQKILSIVHKGWLIQCAYIYDIDNLRNNIRTPIDDCTIRIKVFSEKLYTQQNIPTALQYNESREHIAAIEDAIIYIKNT